MKDIQFIIQVISRFLARHSKGLTLNFGQINQIYLVKFLKGKRILLVGLIVSVLIITVWQLWPKYYLGNALSEGLIGVYSQSTLPITVTHLLSEPLVKLDAVGKPQANLVSGWQVNSNATVYSFKLKGDLYWNDGSKVKSSDIKFNLPDVEVSYPDDKTLEFKLADSFSPFPTLLTTPIFKHNSLVGLGKYRIVHQEQSKSLVIKLVLTPIKKYQELPPVVVRFYPDEKTAMVAFDLGEVDSVVGVSGTDASVQPSAKISLIPSFTKLVAIFYNTKDPILSDKNIRKALGAAAPKLEGVERAKTPIPASSWAFNSDLKDNLGDKDVAKSYLQKVQSGKDSTIALTTIPALADQGEKIIQAWKEIGINAVLRIESGIPQNFQALLAAEPIPLDPDQYALWHSTQGKTNISKYSSPRVDKDLEDGRKTGDMETRKEKYLDFQKVLQDDSPATFLYFPKTKVIFRRKVENILNQVTSLQLL